MLEPSIYRPLAE